MSNLLEPLRPVCSLGERFELSQVRRFLIREPSCDLCRDSREEARNSLESGGTDGSFQRPEESMVAVNVPLLCPRPLPCRPLPFERFSIWHVLVIICQDPTQELDSILPCTADWLPIPSVPDKQHVRVLG
jgi:hypothetical protein